MQSDWGLPQSPNALVKQLETWVFVPGGVGWRSTRCRDPPKSHVCVCLLLQYLLQSFKSSRLRVHANPKARTDALGESEVRSVTESATATAHPLRPTDTTAAGHCLMICAVARRASEALQTANTTPPASCSRTSHRTRHKPRKPKCEQGSAGRTQERGGHCGAAGARCAN